MSHIAHEYKRLGHEEFMKKYKENPYKGLKRVYLDSYKEYHKKDGVILRVESIPKKVVLDYHSYLFYFKYRDKGILSESLENAIPEFLINGLVITEVQEAVGNNA